MEIIGAGLGRTAATADSAYLLLLDPDGAVRRRGVFNCWTLGRQDLRPLILLRRLLSSLTERGLIDGIHDAGACNITSRISRDRT